MQQYLDLLRDISINGTYAMDRTGTGCTSVFGRQLRFDLSKGAFPLLTTKKLHFKSIVHELLWFLKGETNTKYLKDNGVSIWDEWATKEGDLGPVYGAMWRTWPNDVSVDTIRQLLSDFDNWKPHAMSGHSDNGSEELVAALRDLVANKKPIDQIKDLIDGLKNKPFSRRHIVTGWNPTLLPVEGRSHQENIEDGKQALPPCHTIWQVYVEEMSTVERISWVRQNKPDEAAHLDNILVGEIESGMYNDDTADSDQRLIARNTELYLSIEGVPKLRLSALLYCRSQDSFLGTPYNIASYALLTMMLAHVCGYAVGEYIHTTGHTHLYSNHADQVALQLTREPFPLPKVVLNPAVKDIFDFTFDDIALVDYVAHPSIKAPVAV